MKIIEVTQLDFEGILTIKIQRFSDHRGYFIEHYRESDINKYIENFTIKQCNQSFSQKHTIRGLHFQWNPFMGKLVRTISGHMMDIFLDMRPTSPTFGHISIYDMPLNKEVDYDMWIWIPPGFAHGNVYLEDSVIEYLCTGEYSPGCEACVSLFADDINWTLCPVELKNIFNRISKTCIMSDKDKNGYTLKQWRHSITYDIFSHIKPHILVTGGNGLLCSELKKILHADYTTRDNFNIENCDMMDKYVANNIKNNKYTHLIHTAAFKVPSEVEKNPISGIDVNIVGTCNVVKICQKYNIKLIYISTDYVFKGDKECYTESDPMYPVNKYAWSKLGGECAARMYDKSLILRMSFGPNVFPYPKAYIDQYTSRLPVKNIVIQIKNTLCLTYTGVLHLGGPRQSVYNYAKNISNDNISNDIEELSIKTSLIPIPQDTSLNINLYNDLIN